MSGHTHSLSSLSTNASIPMNTIENLCYNPIKQVSKEFDEYKKQQRKKEGNRVDKYHFTYNKLETKEEKEKRNNQKRKNKHFTFNIKKYIYFY